MNWWRPCVYCTEQQQHLMSVEVMYFVTQFRRISPLLFSVLYNLPLTMAAGDDDLTQEKLCSYLLLRNGSEKLIHQQFPPFG